MPDMYYISADSEETCVDEVNNFIKDRALEGEVWSVEEAETKDGVSIASLKYVRDLPSE